jgi:hypothetical protein
VLINERQQRAVLPNTLRKTLCAVTSGLAADGGLIYLGNNSRSLVLAH